MRQGERRATMAKREKGPTAMAALLALLNFFSFLSCFFSFDSPPFSPREHLSLASVASKNVSGEGKTHLKRIQKIRGAIRTRHEKLVGWVQEKKQEERNKRNR